MFGKTIVVGALLASLAAAAPAKAVQSKSRSTLLAAYKINGIVEQANILLMAR